MPLYQTTVPFYKRYSITAKDAKDANEKLDELVSHDEFSADIQHDGYEVFEDEPVECPKCKGRGTIGDDDDQTCAECNGDGSIPFKADQEEK